MPEEAHCQPPWQRGCGPAATPFCGIHDQAVMIYPPSPLSRGSGGRAEFRYTYWPGTVSREFFKLTDFRRARFFRSLGSIQITTEKSESATEKNQHNQPWHQQKHSPSASGTFSHAKMSLHRPQPSSWRPPQAQTLEGEAWTRAPSSASSLASSSPS